uniref:Uncharacterized protein n=1 Tax=Romanomermis culicivorax TaxID=13658 RepID=A0A915I6Q8_ROMCU
MRRQMNIRGGSTSRPCTGRPPNIYPNRLMAFPGSSSTTSTGSSKMPPKAVIVKDQRDFGNKEYVASMIRDIVQVLFRLELKHVANEETLASPKSRNDFEAVFE